MSSKLKQLHIVAVKLHSIGMRQTAGDIDYLISWLMSPETNNGVHKKPDPAGKNTIDANSNNCPIPYTACRESVIACKARFYARALLDEAKDIINELKAIYNESIEATALNEYLTNIDDVVKFLDHEELNDWLEIFPELEAIGDGDDILWPVPNFVQ